MKIKNLLFAVKSYSEGTPSRESEFALTIQNKNAILLFAFFILFQFSLISQNIAINASGNLPDTSAMLDITATDKGLLIPRVALAGTTSNAPIGASIVNSLLVYNTEAVSDVTPGYYYWDAAAVPDQWIRLLNSGSAGPAWLTLGNAGTVDGTNFIGTTDDKPFNIRVNNLKAGRIETNNGISTGGNTFWGFQAGNTTTADPSNGFGMYNTATGYQSLYSNTDGNTNTANGWGTLSNNTIGDGNTANGHQALNNNTMGYGNTANGSSSLYYNIDGFYNTANGLNALFFNTAGYNNTANGLNALYSNTTGNNNTAIGLNALYSNAMGNNATAIGAGAMYYANSVASAFTNFNVAVGFEALKGSAPASANTGNNNTAIGYQTLWSNTTGGSNTALGYWALKDNIIGNYNTAIGEKALYTNVNGSHNVAIGAEALSFGTFGDYNVAVGDSALASTAGQQNTVIGHAAGSLSGASGTVLIGYNVGSSAASNRLMIDNSNTTTPLIFGNFSLDRVGINDNAPAATLAVGGTTKLGIQGTPLTKIIKSTVSINPPSIPAASTTSITAAIANAATTSSVIVSPSVALNAGVGIAYARISSAGTVEITFINATAGAIDPVTQDFYITVIE